ncbi:MAG: shikimate kinase [Amphiplicatus sp.]
MIARLLCEPAHVLATGGGAVLSPQTRRLIKEKALSIWIRADIDMLMPRVARRKTRPLLNNGDPREALTRLLAARAPLYAEADITVESQPGPAARTVKAVLAAIAARRDAEAP